MSEPALLAYSQSYFELRTLCVQPHHELLRRDPFRAVLQVARLLDRTFPMAEPISSCRWYESGKRR